MRHKTRLFRDGNVCRYGRAAGDGAAREFPGIYSVMSIPEKYVGMDENLMRNVTRQHRESATVMEKCRTRNYATTKIGTRRGAWMTISLKSYQVLPGFPVFPNLKKQAAMIFT
jgi:hypothetical protein